MTDAFILNVVGKNLEMEKSVPEMINSPHESNHFLSRATLLKNWTNQFNICVE